MQRFVRRSTGEERGRVTSSGFGAGGKMKQGQMVAGKYRLNRILGTGGMATVWSATNVFTEREFAIKFLLPHVARTADAGKRFLIEAKVSARINHPNIIEIIDVGQAEDGALFLVMELLTGTPLDEAVRSSEPPLAVRDFLVTMRDVASALAVAHQRGVIHRDLKPTNIFLHRDRNGHVMPKVLDFGVSKILDGGDASLTIVGTVLGSPLYMSPEQALGAEGIDQRTDVFAFGAILFEALCGERPYSATNLNGLIVAIATTQPKPIDEVAPDLPVALRALVRDCLVTDKARRIPSFEPVVERLTLLIDWLAESDLRLPTRAPAASQVDGASIDVMSALPEGSAQGSRRTTSVAPHSLPTPDAPVAELNALAAGSFAWPPRRRGVPFGRFAGFAGGALAAAALFVGLSVGPIGRTLAPTSAAGRPPFKSDDTPAQVPFAPDTNGNAGGPVPVDSLPQARHAADPNKHSGRLSVASMPSWCALSVDGVLHGLTPVASFDLSPGTHKLDCVSPAGKSRSAAVPVTEGAEAHYQFVLEDAR
jgi:serine/threonine protein kinase